MAFMIDIDLTQMNVITEGHTSAIARLQSDMTQVLKRLSTVEEWMSVCKQRNTSVSRDTADNVATPVSVGNTNNDVIQCDDRFTATIEALQLQLVQVKQDTAQLNQQSLKTHQLMQQQVQAITGDNHRILLQHKFELQDFINAMQSSAVSKFQQLELLVNTKCVAITDYEQYKAIVDTLAGDSVSSDKFYQLETIVSSLAHSHTATHQQLLQSTEQQCSVVKHLITQLDELNTRHQQLQKFIDDCAKISDPALRRTLDSQQVIVKTMQREVDLYRQDVRTRMTSEIDILRQTLADVAINTLLTRSTSVQLTRTITVKQLVDAEYCVNIMSVSNSGELLIGNQVWKASDNFLHLYDTKGKRHMLSVKNLSKFGSSVRDAVCTSRGNIVYTIGSLSTMPTMVVTTTRTGDIVAKTKMDDACGLSASSDDVIYVACGTRGVYQSRDDGVTWSHVFTCSDKYYAQHAIKVSSDTNTDIFYVLTRGTAEWCLREYTLTKRTSSNNVTWRDIALLHSSPNYGHISMAFDGRNKVFVNQPSPEECKTLRIFSVGQRTESTLDLSEYLSEGIHHVTVDSQRNQLYVSLAVPGTVKVFTLLTV